MVSDGLYPLPAHKLAAVVTYLERDLAGAPPAAALMRGFTLKRLGQGDMAAYSALFAAVGTEWLWFSRLRLAEAALAAILAAPEVHALALIGPEGMAGLLELDFRDSAWPELAFFGLKPAYIGRGLGRGLMGEAIRRAQKLGAGRLNVHTCSLDHPAAQNFYVKSGFRPVRRAVEIFDDPRLDGTLPRAAAAFMPAIGG